MGAFPPSPLMCVGLVSSRSFAYLLSECLYVENLHICSMFLKEGSPWNLFGRRGVVFWSSFPCMERGERV